MDPHPWYPTLTPMEPHHDPVAGYPAIKLKKFHVTAMEPHLTPPDPSGTPPHPSGTPT